MFKKTLLLLAISSVTSVAQGACYGSGDFKTCYDTSGSNYTVNKIGNTTLLNGSNTNGSTWSQSSTTYGNSTYHSGRAANGNSWNSTVTNHGYGTSTYGTDSSGGSFNHYQSNSDPYSMFE